MTARGRRAGACRLLLNAFIAAGSAIAADATIARAQDDPPPAAANPYPRAFEAVDIGMGVVLIQDAEPGIGFSVGADVSNFIIKGLSTRFSFRLWATQNVLGTLRIVELDDFAFGVMQKLRLGEPGFAAYGGIGLSLHIISARIRDTDRTAPRNGARPGVDLQLGLEIPLAEGGFITLFADGVGSFVPDISQAMLQFGMRLRFDSLPAG